MASNIVRHWNNRVIRQREDGYLSGTDMAQANGKLIADWIRLKSTKNLFDVFESRYGDPHNGSGIRPVDIIQGGVPENQGTWLHPKIAIQFGQWCSPDFALQVSDWIQELMTTGSVTIAPDPIPTPPPIPLPPADIRIDNLHRALTGFGIDLKNPRFQQSIQDLVMDKILGIPALPEATETWLGVVEKAERMGYPVPLITKNRASIGKFVASFDLERKQEKRLCNGTMRDINLYLDCPELEEAIADFMDAKILSTAASPPEAE